MLQLLEYNLLLKEINYISSIIDNNFTIIDRKIVLKLPVPVLAFPLYFPIFLI